MLEPAVKIKRKRYKTPQHMWEQIRERQRRLRARRRREKEAEQAGLSVLEGCDPQALAVIELADWCRERLKVRLRGWDAACPCARLTVMSNPTLPDDLRRLNQDERAALAKIAGSDYSKRKDAEFMLRVMLLALSVSRRLQREGK